MTYTCNQSNLSNNLQTQLARLCDKYEISHDNCNAIADGQLTMSTIRRIAEAHKVSDYDAKILFQIAVAA